MLQFPDALQLLTWVVLALELLFLPLSFHRVGRLVGWATMCSLHIGIVLLIDFADLSAGMLMVHLFTFDRAWLRSRGVMTEPVPMLVKFAR